jgi:hypothetical protein
MKVILGMQYVEDDQFTPQLVSEFNDKGIDVKIIKKYNKRGILKYLQDNSDCDGLILQEYIESLFPVTVDYINTIERDYPNVNIVFIISNEHKQDTNYLANIFNNKIYNVLFESDANVSDIVNLIQNPRQPKVAQSYFNLQSENIKEIQDTADEDSNVFTKIPQEQIDSIYSHLISAKDIEDLYRRYDYVVSKYNEKKNVYIVTQLPCEITEKLEDNLNYQKFYKILQTSNVENLSNIPLNKSNIKEKIVIKNKFSSKEPKEKVKIKEKIVTKEIIQHVYQPPVEISNKLIVVVNLSKRAGATFVTLNLAKALSELDISTAVIETPLDKPYIFDTVGLEQKLEETEEEGSLKFYSYQHVIIDGKEVEKNKETIVDKISWIVSDPRRSLIKETKCEHRECLGDLCREKQCKNRSWDYFKMMQLIYASKAAINIIDCGSYYHHESVKPVLSQADMVLVVVDPLPAEIMQNEDILSELLEMKKSEFPIEFIFNRWNEGVDKKKLLKFIFSKENKNEEGPLCYIPSIEAKYISKAIYDCQIPYSNKEIKEQLKKPLEQIIKKVVPEELLLAKKKYEKISFKNKFLKKIGLRKGESKN